MVRWLIKAVLEKITIALWKKDGLNSTKGLWVADNLRKPLILWCLFVSAPASSAPSAPSLGGSLSVGSHSGGADPEQAWPQSSGEEDLQLQLALAMSKEEAEQVTQSSLFILLAKIRIKA